MTDELNCFVCEGKLPNYPVRSHDAKLFCKLDCFKEYLELLNK